jgi:hypothetical protein
MTDLLLKVVFTNKNIHMLSNFYFLINIKIEEFMHIIH